MILIGLDIEQCPLSGGSPFLRGFKYTSSMVNSIGALMVVRFTEVVHFWEGPLREVSLYMKPLNKDSLRYETTTTTTTTTTTKINTNKNQQE